MVAEEEQSFGETNREMLDSGFLSDVKVEVGLPHSQQQVLSLHKYILASRSPVFKAMFSHNFKENDAERIKVAEDPAVFKQIVEYLYCGQTPVNHANVLSLYLTSRKYLMQGLEAACINHLQKYINDREVFLMLDFLVRYDDPQAIQMCLDYINPRINYLGYTRSFLDITKPALQAIICSDGLDLPEEDVYQMCISWAKHSLLKEKENAEEDYMNDAVSNDVNDDVTEQLPETKKAEVKSVKDDTNVTMVKTDDVGDEEIREKLDGVLNLVRFPTMGTLTFAKRVDTSEVLTNEEKCAIYRFMITSKSKCLAASARQQPALTFPSRSRRPERPGTVSILSPTDSFSCWLEANKIQAINFKLLTDARLAGFAIYDWINEDIRDQDQIIAVRMDLREAKESFGEVTGPNLITDRDLQFINVGSTGQVRYPVFLRDPLVLERELWYSLRVTIRYKPSHGPRKTLCLSHEGMGEARIESEIKCVLKYFPVIKHNSSYSHCDVIPQLLFSPS